VFVDAPHALPPPRSARSSGSGECAAAATRYAWLVSRADADWSAAAAVAAAAGAPPPPPPPLQPRADAEQCADASPYAQQSEGWGASLATIVAALRAHAPVDGLLGLSQGAAAAAAAAAALQDGCGDADACALPQLRFVWLAGGFVAAPTAALLQQRSTPLPLPSLHVYGGDADATQGGGGGGDAQVAARHSAALASCFAAPSVIRHAQGHLLPAARQHCREYAAFLNQFLN
jgi:hypothetical protein